MARLKNFWRRLNVAKRYQEARISVEAEARALQISQERFRVTLASLGDAVIATDSEGRITFLNPATERLTG